MHFVVLDKYISAIIKSRDVSLVTAVIFSLRIPQDADLEKLIRDKDIALLENITKRMARFLFSRKWIIGCFSMHSLIHWRVILSVLHRKLNQCL